MKTNVIGRTLLVAFFAIGAMAAQAPSVHQGGAASHHGAKVNRNVNANVHRNVNANVPEIRTST